MNVYQCKNGFIETYFVINVDIPLDLIKSLYESRVNKQSKVS